MVSAGSGLPSLSSRALGRPHPRWEPDAVTPLVRIYGGGCERSRSLLRLLVRQRVVFWLHTRRCSDPQRFGEQTELWSTTHGRCTLRVHFCGLRSFNGLLLR